jgi:hypothetical protein
MCCCRCVLGWGWSVAADVGLGARVGRKCFNSSIQRPLGGVGLGWGVSVCSSIQRSLRGECWAGVECQCMLQQMKEGVWD